MSSSATGMNATSPSRGRVLSRESSRGRSASRGSVWRECDYLGPYQLIAATPNVCRYVVQGDSRYVEVRVRRLVKNQQHVRNFMRRLAPLTSWAMLPKAVNQQLERESQRPVGPNTWEYQNELYQSGVHFAAPLHRLESMTRARSRSRAPSVEAAREKPLPDTAATREPVRNRARRVKNAGTVSENHSTRSNASTGLVGSVVAAATGAVDALVGGQASAGEPLGSVSFVWLLCLAMVCVRVPFRAVAYALLFSALAHAVMGSGEVFLFRSQRAPVRGDGFLVRSEWLEFPAVGGCLLKPTGCFSINYTSWELGDSFAVPACGYFPRIRTVACPQGCTYQGGDEPYVCAATNLPCSVVPRVYTPGERCWMDNVEVAVGAYPLEEPTALTDVHALTVRDDVAGGTGVELSLCGSSPRIVKVGSVELSDVLCETLLVVQDGGGTERLSVCVDKHCESVLLRRPLPQFTVLPGAFDCDRRYGTKCSMAAWDPARRALVRSYAANVTMTVRLGGLAFVSFKPYSVELACNGAICPVSKDIYGQAEFRILGFDVGPVTLPSDSCRGLSCYQWRLIVIHASVWFAATALFSVMFYFGTWRWWLLCFMTLVAYSVSVGQPVFWRRVAGWCFAGVLAFLAIGVMAIRRKPRMVKLAAVYVVLASVLVGSYAQCVGIQCNITAANIRCDVDRYVRCGRALRPCPANYSSLGPYFEFAPAKCVAEDPSWDSTAVLYWSLAQRIGYGQVNTSALQKYVLIGSAWYRVDAGYLRPVASDARRLGWSVLLLLPAAVAGYVVNIPVQEAAATILRKLATWSYFLSVVIVFLMRLPFGRSIVLVLLLTTLYLPSALAVPVVSDVVLPAAPGACVQVETTGNRYHICVVNRTDHLHVSRVMDGVSCEMQLVHRLECDHQRDELPTCENYPADMGRSGRMIDHYQHCTETRDNEMVACSMATLAHSWCYVAQWVGCYSFYTVRELPGPVVTALSVHNVHTVLTIAVNGSLAELSEGDAVEVRDLLVGFIGVNARPVVPTLLWEFNGTVYVPTLATTQFAGPFQCIRDASGRFTYDKSRAEVHVRSVGLGLAYTPPEVFIRDDNTLRSIETFAGCGCTHLTNRTLMGCQCGQVFLRLTSTGHSYVSRSAQLTAVNVERIECLTVDNAVSIYLQLVAALSGQVTVDPALCVPRVLGVDTGVTNVVLSCRRESDRFQLTVGGLPVGVVATCRVAESILDTPFKLIPYVPEVASDGLPALSTDFWAAFISKYLWAISVAAAVVIALIVLPIVIHLIRLAIKLIDRSSKAAMGKDA